MAKFICKRPINISNNKPPRVDYPVLEPLELDPELFPSLRERVIKHITPMSEEDKHLLCRYEEIIKVNYSGFLLTAIALYYINKLRLYRGTHTRFYDYVWDVWGIKKSAAYERIQTAIIYGRITRKMRKKSDAKPLCVQEAKALLLLSGLSDDEMLYLVIKAQNDAPGGALTTNRIRAVTKNHSTQTTGKPGRPRNPARNKDKKERIKYLAQTLAKFTKFLSEDTITKDFRNDILAILNPFTNKLRILNHVPQTHRTEDLRTHNKKKVLSKKVPEQLEA